MRGIINSADQGLKKHKQRRCELSASEEAIREALKAASRDGLVGNREARGEERVVELAVQVDERLEEQGVKRELSECVDARGEVGVGGGLHAGEQGLHDYRDLDDKRHERRVRVREVEVERAHHIVCVCPRAADRAV